MAKNDKKLILAKTHQNTAKGDQNSNFAIIFQLCSYLEIYRQKQPKIAKKATILCSFWLFLPFLAVFADKFANMSKAEKLWQNLNFGRFWPYFDGFMGKIKLLPFLANLAGKQTNIGKN